MTPEELHHYKTIGEFEDAPQRELTYQVAVGAQVFLIRAVDSDQAERRGRAAYRKAYRLPYGSLTPPAAARYVGAANEKPAYVANS